MLSRRSVGCIEHAARRTEPGVVERQFPASHVHRVLLATLADLLGRQLGAIRQDGAEPLAPRDLTRQRDDRL